MKPLIAPLLFMAGIASAATETPAPKPAAAATGGLRHTIAVTSFENRTKYPGQFLIADTWSGMLTESLSRSGKFIVIGEADMRAAAVAEQDLSKAGRTAAGDKAPVTGKMTPAQLLMKGEITHFEDGVKGSEGGISFKGINLGRKTSTAEINVLVYIVDASTAQVLATKKVVGKAKSSSTSLGFVDKDWASDMASFRKTNVGQAIEAAIDQAVAFCAAQIGSLPWSGSVIQVREGSIIINRGSREGVEAGRRFRVGISEQLRDPGTGELLDTQFTEKAVVRVDSVKEKIATCVVESGGGIEPGMAVLPQ